MKSAINSPPGTKLYQEYSSAILELADECSWANIAKMHSDFYEKIAPTESWVFPKLPSTDLFLQMHRDSYVVEKDVTEDY